MRKSMLFILTFILIILSSGCTLLTNKPVDSSEITLPEDFSFSITWNCYGISSYESKTGTLIKTTDATKPEDYIIEMHLPEDELKNIYLKLTEDINLFSYSDKYNPFRKGYDSRPTQTIILSITATQKTKTVTCKNIAFGEEKWMKNKKARDFMRVQDEIVDILTSTEEWKSLPDYEFGYD